MVDFDKLKTRVAKPAPIEPLEIFRRLPKPQGINDLYTSQAEVLERWFEKRAQRDTVVKLHTGGGKTLVGLLMAQSVLNETREPVLYLAPTKQLVNQTIEKAKAVGLPVVAYGKGPLDDDFINSKAIMVATYKALFHGHSKFGVRGGSRGIVKVGAVIVDDAHVAFPVLRESFTLTVDANNRELYRALTSLFRNSFRESDRLGTFDDTVSNKTFGVIEVPYWSWHQQIDAVAELVRPFAEDQYSWPLLRDNLRLCHALISSRAFTITMMLPLVNLFPTFSEAPRRIFMSATIADDSEIVRTFDADAQHLNEPLSSRSLAGISERMILIPELMPFKFKVTEQIKSLLHHARSRGLGSAVLVPSDKAAVNWVDCCEYTDKSAEVEALVGQLQTGETIGPAVFANRYDGIDLPGDSCRLLVVDGLPTGTSDFELFRAATLSSGVTISRMLAQRIEQGIGRGARGAGDHCVVLLTGADLAGWIAKDAHFRLLTSATRAQLDMGFTISRQVDSVGELFATIEKSFARDSSWMGFHAESLAESVTAEKPDERRFDVATVERKAFNNWVDAYHAEAISKIERQLGQSKAIDVQTRGWLLQLAARIAHQWGQSERSEQLQREAFALNRNLQRPKVLPPYRPLVAPGAQSQAICKQLGDYRYRKGFLAEFEKSVAMLHANSSATQFEQALVDLAFMIGLSAERFDDNGKGPDLIWLLPGRGGWIVEAKSRKKDKSALTKDDHGQLLVAGEWFKAKYPDYKGHRVSVLPTNHATPMAEAQGSFALTFEKLAALVADARALLDGLCGSQLAEADLMGLCEVALATSPLRADRLSGHYLLPFVARPIEH